MGQILCAIFSDLNGYLIHPILYYRTVHRSAIGITHVESTKTALLPLTRAEWQLQRD